MADNAAHDTPAAETETAGDEPTQSPLRGSLETNDDGSGMHDMGGNIGPASDRTAAQEPPSAGEEPAQQLDAAQEQALAVDSPPQGELRDDPDDPAGGDTGIDKGGSGP